MRADLRDKYSERGNIASVTLWYPGVESEDPKIVQVELMDVRAADDIQISYDYDRDGWVIKQASCWEWDYEDEDCDSDWQEVAFVKAWAREKKTTEIKQYDRVRLRGRPQNEVSIEGKVTYVDKDEVTVLIDGYTCTNSFQADQLEKID